MLRPNGEAQSPTDGYGIVKWYGGKHEITFQKCLVQPVGWSALLGRASFYAPPVSVVIPENIHGSGNPGQV